MFDLVLGAVHSGSILGTVKGASGVLVPDADVVLTNKEEGTSRSMTSGSGGQFQFEDAKAGRYSLAVTREGFERWSTDNLVLTARQQLRVDAALVVGSMQVRVEVTSQSTAAINTEDGSCDWLPVAGYLCGCGQWRLHHLLWAGLLRYRE